MLWDLGVSEGVPVVILSRRRRACPRIREELHFPFWILLCGFAFCGLIFDLRPDGTADARR